MRASQFNVRFSLVLWYMYVLISIHIEYGENDEDVVLDAFRSVQGKTDSE